MNLNTIFTDHMVLQRDTFVALFGEGTGHAVVTIGDTVNEFDVDGSFLRFLDPMPAGGPYTMTVTIGDESVTFQDVLIGDVYLAGGQSNMQFRVEESADVPRLPHGRVRHFTEGHYADENRNETFTYTPWQVATEETLLHFSAIGYDVGRMLSDELDVPVGIISCNIGASRVDAWTSPETVNTPEYQALIAQKHSDWHYYRFNHDSWCYEQKLSNVFPYSIAGVLWYQGESNRLEAEAVHYHTLLETMIDDWRHVWSADLPFYVVQIAPHKDAPHNDWAHVRQAQERVAKTVEGVYLCTLTHTGEADNIHPTKKHALAVALKNAILCNAFGHAVEYCGPVYDQVTKTADGVLITFTHAAGLHFEGEPADLSVFDGAGNPLPYTATIEGNALRVTAPEATRVELGFCNAPTHNLYNGDGYLASPFQIIL